MDNFDNFAEPLVVCLSLCKALIATVFVLIDS